MRKSERDSDERRDNAPAQLLMKRKRKARDSAESKPEPNAQPSQTSDGRASRSNDDPDHDHTRPVEITFDETKIALPFADTPIIRKNRDMRRGTQGGSRRSSLGMRGRRASSLIDAGRSNGKILYRFAKQSLLMMMMQLYHMTKLKAQISISILQVMA